jgi:hypothetical protein
VTFDITVFRTNFPEFADDTVYTDSTITFWAGLAEKLVRLSVWGECWTEGVSLYVAHEITLAANAEKAANAGGVPGVMGGIAQNKAVGNASVGYDTQSTAEKDAGWWNLTNYGKQFIRLARIFGAGVIQL